MKVPKFVLYYRIFTYDSKTHMFVGRRMSRNRIRLLHLDTEWSKTYEYDNHFRWHSNMDAMISMWRSITPAYTRVFFCRKILLIGRHGGNIISGVDEKRVKRGWQRETCRQRQEKGVVLLSLLFKKLFNYLNLRGSKTHDTVHVHVTCCRTYPPTLMLW